MTYSTLLLLIALTCAAQSRSVIVLPAGPAVDPTNRNATILDIETWKPIGNPAVGIDAYQAFTLPDGSKTYIVAKGAANTVTVLAELSSGGKVLKSIDLPTGSTDAALTPDGKRLLIVSITDPALTVINTVTDRVIARIPLAAPANSVVVNFDSTVAFTASPNGAVITFVNLGGNYTINGQTVDILAGNTVMGSLPLQKSLPITSRLAFAPNGQLYTVAGDLLLEIDPNTQTVTALGIAAKGVEGRPQFLFDGSQTLMAGSGGLALATLRQFRIDGTYAKPGVSIDHVRIVSESRAIGYSSADRTFYRIDLKPFLDVTPIAGLAELGRQHVAGIGGTPEDPQNRYIFLSSGSTVHRLDAKSNVVTASQTIGNIAGLAISPPVPSRGPVARIVAIDPRHPASLPLVARALDASGLPVRSAQVNIGEFSGDSGGIWRLFANADGYVHRDDLFGGSYEIYADTSSSSSFFSSFYDVQRRYFDAREAPVLPTTFRMHSGNGQIVDAGSEAPHTLQVRMMDQRELPIAGVPVEWSISGGGQLKTLQTVTDSRGIATNVFTGPVLSPVQQYLRSTIVAIAPGLPVINFTMATLPAVPNGTNDAATSRVVRLSAAFTATAGTRVGDALRYRITPPIRGISLEVGDSQRRRPVRCENSSVSGDDGVVTCTLFVGEGAQRAKVYIGGREVESLPIKVLPGSPEIARSFGLASGWGRSYVARNAPVVAIIEDGFGNAVNDVPVTWDISPANAAVALDGKSAPGRYFDPERPSIAVLSDGLVSARANADATIHLSIPFAESYFSRAIFDVGDPGYMFILDGDDQSAAAKEDFVRPLVVQMRGNGFEPLRGFPVGFTATGGVVVSPAVAFTDAQGRAEFNVTAGSSLGAQTVTAAVGLRTITFKLTVTPKLEPPPPAPKPLPAITSIVNGASFLPGLSPCAMAQLTGRNFATGTYLAIGGHPAPISTYSATSITFQVPCELPPGPTPLQLTSASDSVIQQVTIAPYAPGVFENAGKQAVALRADGTYVSATNPAELGEEIRLFATGLGQASPLLATNTPGSGERVNAKVLIGLGNEGIEAEAVYAPALTGTYLVTLRIPRSIAPGTNRPIGVAIQTPDGLFVHSQPSRIDIR